MHTQAIRDKIAAAIAEEKETQTLEKVWREQITRALKQSGSSEPVSKTQVEFMVQATLRGHCLQLEQVPDLLEELAASATKAGIADAVLPVLEVAEAYFLVDDDVIPDHLGLTGLRDDTYLALSLIQTVSDNYREATGSPLIAANLWGSIKALRTTFTREEAQQLDEAVGVALARPQLQQVLTTLATSKVTLPVEGWTMQYGNASTEDVARARLGAMGVT